MINYKLTHNLIGAENWPRIATVFIKGVPNETNVSSNKLEEENEKIIQSWKNVVVLRATSKKPTEIYIGFYNQAIASFLKHEFKTNLDYAMRIGPGDINFFVFPKNLTTKINLEIIEQTTDDNPKYSNLILI